MAGTALRGRVVHPNLIRRSRTRFESFDLAPRAWKFWNLVRKTRESGSAMCGVQSACSSQLSRGLGALEMVMRRAVVAVRQRRALTGLALARRCAAAGDPAVERTGLDLLLDEAHRGIDSLVHRPGDLRLHRDREVAPDVLEERLVGLGEIVRICSEALHRPLGRSEHLTAVLQLRLLVDEGIDQVVDRAMKRPRVLIHAVLDMKDPFVHIELVRSPRL